MQNHLAQVKFPVSGILALICVMGLFGCTSAPKSRAPSLNFHSNYISLPLEFSVYDQTRRNIETKENVQLKNRGEAHVTVITPPEWDKLSAKVTMEEAREVVRLVPKGLTEVHEICRGRAQIQKDDQDLKTYFVVVQTPGLVQYREELARLFESRGGTAAEFSATHYYPHVTLGFTERDLHEQDGVIKDERTCVREL